MKTGSLGTVYEELNWCKEGKQEELSEGTYESQCGGKFCHLDTIRNSWKEYYYPRNCLDQVGPWGIFLSALIDVGRPSQTWVAQVPRLGVLETPRGES